MKTNGRKRGNVMLHNKNSIKNYKVTNFVHPKHPSDDSDDFSKVSQLIAYLSNQLFEEAKEVKKMWNKILQEDKGDFLKRVIFIVQSTEEANEKVPYRSLSAVNVYYYLYLTSERFDVKLIQITNEMMNHFHLSEEELYEVARKNRRILFPEVMKTETRDKISLTYLDKQDIFFPLKTEKNFNNAGTFLYPSVMDKYSLVFPTGYIIILCLTDKYSYIGSVKSKEEIKILSKSFDGKDLATDALVYDRETKQFISARKFCEE